MLFLTIVHSVSAAETALPNVLFIVADDVGFSDLGCYGGEIETSNLDRLALDGIRFSEFHVNPMCVVTRTSLMTGHTHSQSDQYRRSIPLARMMRAAGYSTSLSGKWHQPGHPLDAGFDSFYGFLGGAINSWTGVEGGHPAIQVDRNPPKPVAPGWYSSDAFADKAIEQISNAVQRERPFFAYLAFNAPHTPLHAPREYVEKYYARYRRGWDVLRGDRYKRLREMGLIDDQYRMVQPDAEVRRWHELPESVQEQETRRMAAYAGMLDRMDWNVGRVLSHLEESNLENNTIVMFMADNGGAYNNGNIQTYDSQIPWNPDSSPFASNGWAYLKNTPFRWYKSCAQEGGVSVPLIVRWPAKVSGQEGSIRTQRIHVTDIYPTMLEVIGSVYPQIDGDRALAPLYGTSMMPLLTNANLPDRAIHDEMFWAFNQTGKGMVSGEWKISSISDGPWRLYNITKDPAESRNLATSRPAIVERLSRRWFAFARSETAMPPSWRDELKPYQEGWGFHRMRMAMPGFVRATPASSAMNVPRQTSLTFHYSSTISFDGSSGRTLRLYEVGDANRAIWKADPEPGHPSEGSTSITFNNLPELKPSTTYFALSDPGWITIGGNRAVGLNDGAYWYRFRTASE